MAHDVVVEFDADGSIISIDIDLASKKLDLDTLEMNNFPGYLIKTAWLLQAIANRYNGKVSTL